MGRTKKARNKMRDAAVFGVNTCPASRHVAMMAEELLKGGTYKMFTDEPEHCGESLAAVVQNLWEMRTHFGWLPRQQKALDELEKEPQ